MPANFLGKLLGRRAQAKPALAEAIADLERLARERPSLASAAALLRDVLPLVCGISVREQPPAIPAERAAGKLAKGVPLLRGEPVDLDDRAFRRRWQDVCAAIERHRQDKTARTLAEALDRGITEPVASTPEDVSGAQRQQRVAQWMVPVFTGALLVVSSLAGEQQKPGSVRRGVGARVRQFLTPSA